MTFSNFEKIRSIGAIGEEYLAVKFESLQRLWWSQICDKKLSVFKIPCKRFNRLRLADASLAYQNIFWFVGNFAASRFHCKDEARDPKANYASRSKVSICPPHYWQKCRNSFLRKFCLNVSCGKNQISRLNFWQFQFIRTFLAYGSNHLSIEKKRIIFFKD